MTPLLFSRWPAAPARTTVASFCVALFAFANRPIVLVVLTALCFAFQHVDARPYRHADQAATCGVSNPDDIASESSREEVAR